MAKSFVIYPAQTGATDTYSIPFEYLDQGFVKATVDGVSAPFAFTSTYLMRFDTAPVGDLKIYRETSTEIINEYSNGSILDANDLNVSLYQTMHIAEEIADNTIQNDVDGDWDAKGLRIKNVANPVNPGDVATKDWAETAGGSFVAQAGAHAATSGTHAGTATTKAAEATTQADRANTQANRSTTQADRAEDEADRAEAEANRATTQAGIATTQAGISTTKAGEASASATTATTGATTATTQAGVATAQAGIATTKASEASTDRAAVQTLRNETQGFRNEAEDFKDQAAASAASLNAANLLTKDGNLAGLTDPAAAVSNLNISNATASKAGFMSAADKSKLDAVKSMANRNVTISTVAPTNAQGTDGDVWFLYT